MVPLATYMLFGRGFHVREHSVVLSFIFLGMPFFDMVNGYLIVGGYLPEGTLGSPSQVGRFLAACMLLYFIRAHKHTLFWLLFFAALTAIETVAGFRSNSVTGVLFGYMTIFRFFYIYLLFIALIICLNHDKGIVGRYLKYNILFIGISIIFAHITGLGHSTYGWGSGTKGFFASGNGLGIYIGVSAVVLAALKHYKIYENTGVSTFIISFVSLVLLGTKTAFILALIILLLTFWFSRIRFFIFPVLICVVVFLWRKISEVLSVYFDIVIFRYNNSPTLQDFIFSGRDTYVENAFLIFFQQNIDFLRWLFGGGAFLSFQNPSQVSHFDTLESDPFDVFFMYGLIGFIAYFFLLAFGVKIFLRYPVMLLSFALLGVHSIFAGHVLFNGMSSTLFIVILAIGYSWKNRLARVPRLD